MIVLASKSPRRKMLMSKDISKDFLIVDSNIDESLSTQINPVERTMDIARRKGEAVKENYPNDLIVTADTIVVIDNQIIGKPKDEADAKRMLKMLSGRTHEVITAYCLFYKNQFITNHVSSYVKFNNLTDELIDRYVQTKSPLDKAGAYGLQDNDKYPIVEKVDGSLKNVIGFPTDEIKIDIQKIMKC